MKNYLFLFIAATLSAHALETDNYLTWDKNLPDSMGVINQLIQDQIEDVLAKTSPKEDLSCKAITFRIANRFKTTPGEKLFENYLQDNYSHQMYPKNPYYLQQSIFRNTSRIYLSKSGLSPSINAGGIYLGVDKLSHFGSTGRRYLKNYLKKLNSGHTADEAEKSAIRLGLSNELRVLGLWPSGVFSYGDVEANFQGYRFYKKLCLDTQDNYLKKENGVWRLVKIPDMKEYISPYWDETFNPSFLGKGMWAVTSKIIRDEYCALRSSGIVMNRFKFYGEFLHTSPSLTYVEELQKRQHKLAPDPSQSQSIDKLCEL